MKQEILWHTYSTEFSKKKIMAVDAVRIEPVSTRISLLTGKIIANI
jgi:hypothetical protein